MPLGFVAAVALLSAATAVLVALPLYLAATRATGAYNVVLAVSVGGALLLVLGRSLARRARRSGDTAGYARRLISSALWSMARLLGGLGAAYLALLTFRIGPVAGAAASIVALGGIALLVGLGRGAPSAAGPADSAPPTPPPATP